MNKKLILAYFLLAALHNIAIAQDLSKDDLIDDLQLKEQQKYNLTQQLIVQDEHVKLLRSRFSDLYNTLRMYKKYKMLEGNIFRTFYFLLQIDPKSFQESLDQEVDKIIKSSSSDCQNDLLTKEQIYLFKMYNTQCIEADKKLSEIIFKLEKLSTEIGQIKYKLENIG